MSAVQPEPIGLSACRESPPTSPAVGGKLPLRYAAARPLGSSISLLDYALSHRCQPGRVAPDFVLIT
jgi:hypothetical protein